MLADAAAVVSAALPYGSGATRAGLWRHVAAHSRGRDYHATLRDRLTVIAAEISARFPTSALRVVVDTAPLAERTWAVLAGIGALGGNGALFVPGSGSRVLLGEIIVAAVPPPIAATGDRPDDPCRGCGRCVAACPTGALRAGGFVDCERCLSYHTIENVRGPVPDAVRAATRLVFGCDACTDACPRNAAAEDRCGLEPPPRAGAPFLALTRIAAMPEAELAALVEGTCLARTGAATLRRSAAHAVAARRAPEEP
jgi:epoxyqueuosine reductase